MGFRAVRGKGPAKGGRAGAKQINNSTFDAIPNLPAGASTPHVLQGAWPGGITLAVGRGNYNID